jgi:DNA-binding MarR family transcriptional regulator
MQYFGNITFYNDKDDPDNDDLTNIQEYGNNTDPLESDTDQDGMPDGWEVQFGLDPKNPSDKYDDLDNDGATNYEEYRFNTDPNNNTNKPIDSGKKADSDDEADGSSFLLCGIFIVPGFIILLAIIFIYTKMRREQLLEHKLRANINTYIHQNPGIHYRKILTDLNLHMGVLTHHLNMLEQMEYIKSVQDGMYRRFYPKDASVDSGFILNDTQQRILHTIQGTPGISKAAIARNLNITKKAVYYNVKVLTEAGFIHEEQDGRESKCFYLDGLDYPGSGGHVKGTEPSGPPGPSGT